MMKIRTLARSPRFRQRAQRLVLPMSVLTACFATLDSLPDPGKSWRPVLVAQITATWLAVGVSVVVAIHGQRKAAGNGTEPIPEQPG